MKFLDSDPWADVIRDVNQSVCEYPGAEEIQPHSIDLPGYLKALRSIWASSVLFDKPIPTAVFQNPFRKSHPMIEALCFVLAKQVGKEFPPISSPSPTLPMSELCQLALLWGIAGEEGKELAQNLLPFHSFSALWCPEALYDEKESLCSIALLLRSFGKYVEIPSNPDPYFIALAKLSPKWEEGPPAKDWKAALVHGSDMTAVFATSGEGVPLGALQAGNITIPAFGPQVYPLNDPTRFGIRRSLPNRRWTAASAMPEVWFEANSDLDKGLIETRFFGLSVDLPLAFAFYVKADSAQIKEEIFKPNHLNRYEGDPQKIIFEKNGSRLSVLNDSAVKMELIPLAGKNCFWNAEFLLAFEISPLEGKELFKFEKG